MPIYVISDLHIGAGELDDCDPHCEATLVQLFGRIAASSDPAELVLNGDSFDFVQATPWEGPGLESETSDGVPQCFTQATSCLKMVNIINAHPALFDALANMLKNPFVQLTVMPGNHDADLFWNRVQEILVERLGGVPLVEQGRLKLYLDRVYRPAAAPHVWIEHGHQYDPRNWFFVEHAGRTVEYWSETRRPIVSDVGGEPRLLECIGTRFLIRFLNGLDKRYPFVDNIKPFGKFVDIFLSSAATLSGGTVRAALAGMAAVRFGLPELLLNTSGLLSANATATRSISRGLQAVEDASSGRFSDALIRAGYNFGGDSFSGFVSDAPQAVALLDFALAHLDELDAVVVDAASMLSIDSGLQADGMLSLFQGFSFDETAKLRDAAADALMTAGCTAVIMGHTHDAIDDKFYKNTGSWTRFWDIPSARKLDWKQMLKASADMPLTPRYALIHEDPAKAVELIMFQPQ